MIQVKYIIKLISPVSLTYLFIFSVAARKFKMTCVVHIVFLLDSTALK